MKAILSERNLVLVLFVMVFITFSLAHEDSKKMEKGYMGINTYASKNIALLQQQRIENSPSINTKAQNTSDKDE